MRTTEINWEKAPKEGYALACFRQEVLFQKLEPGVVRQISENRDMLLELHVFDKEREYRLMRCGTGEFIETVVSDENGIEKKEETVQVESRFEGLMRYLRIVNYIDYDENGMLSIRNYRFAPVEGGR